MAVDFQRDVYCLFGLPVDNLTREKTISLLREKARTRQNAVWATVNVNWVIQASRDRDFRRAILNSDIVTLDGKPLLWLARGLQYPMRETVPGSTLIQLIKEKGPENPMTIFLFGGEADAARQAMEKINQHPCGLRAVGALNPGFGSVEEMSTDQIINTINQASPDLLLVALGAQKGTQWIEHNRHRLRAGVISHLGATVNFLAGTVKRAPRSFRFLGLEWVWRIMQEPKLFSRYASDGIALLGLVSSRILFWATSYREGIRKTSEQNEHKSYSKRQEHKLNTVHIRELINANPHHLTRKLTTLAHRNKQIFLDFNSVQHVSGDTAARLVLFFFELDKYSLDVIPLNITHNIIKSLHFFMAEPPWQSTDILSLNAPTDSKKHSFSRQT